jgi:hypothetical protein
LPHPLEKSLAPFRFGAPSASAKGSSKAKRSTSRSPEAAQTSSVPSHETAIAELAAWMEPRHTLLLRTLLDRTPDVRAAGAPAVARGAHRVLEGLRRDIRLKYAEFRERWEARLEPKALLPFLNRNQWIQPYSVESEAGASADARADAVANTGVEVRETRVVLAGKGGRKEARMLYLQTGHDMATDCARQWASLAGRLQVFQSSFASEWHAAVVVADDDATRLLPTLEAALRDAEFEAWKKLRLSLGELAEEAFINAALRWESRPFANPEALVRGTLHPWVAHSPSRNGWSGFMRVLSYLGERMALSMLDHYERKWELYLRGLPANAPESARADHVITQNL